MSDTIDVRLAYGQTGLTVSLPADRTTVVTPRETDPAPDVAAELRRALREARNNGEQVVVVDGQEFNTGLIPVTRPRAAEQAPAPTSAPDDDASSTGGWTSIMSGWLKDRQEGK